HSIMDWPHPDYLPRRGWEEAERPAEGAEFERYLEYLHAQVTELLTKYGPIGVMWFDGEWESTWSHERGQALYDLCRRLQPDVIVNNRVDVGRSGMAGLTEGPGYAGDFGTPEQEVPATGLPGVDWESCITMNNHWGWNEADLGWKSTSELVRLLVDVVSKGGNLLLNVGPRADGSFPPQAVERLQGIARWMRLHGEAIHGTQASPFAELPWGRCTKKRDGADTRLFLHVFDWPADGKLVIQGLGNDSFHACLLADGSALAAERAGTDLWIWLPEQPTDPDCPVIELRVNGEPIVYLPPRIEAAFDEFATYVDVEIKSASPALEVRFRRDGGEPGITDPVVDYPLRLRASVVITARAFHRGLPVSATVRREFRRVELLPAGDVPPHPGLLRRVYRGSWDVLPDWSAAVPVGESVATAISLGEDSEQEGIGLLFEGFVDVPEDGMWIFSLTSDDGSQLRIAGRLVVDNDGLHGAETREEAIALAAGWHAFDLRWFNRTGGAVLELKKGLPGERLSPIAHDEFGRR
ncbi:MAG: alpha-L-fucosidase, partial [Planctomycetota bacterium]|nr:alpha-L-fucosidase [Planctomycetota bacterium]